MALRDNPKLEEELTRLMAQKEPLVACAYCLGSSGPWVRHRLLRGHAELEAARLNPSGEEHLRIATAHPAAAKSGPVAP